MKKELEGKNVERESKTLSEKISRKNKQEANIERKFRGIYYFLKKKKGMEKQK